MFYLDLSVNNGLQLPKKLCFNCFTKMRNIKKRPTATVNPISIPAWLPHSENCNVCHHFNIQRLENQNGGRKAKKSIPKGRPSKNSEPVFWTRQASIEIAARIEFTFPENFFLKDFEEKYNPQLNLCKCAYCFQ